MENSIAERLAQMGITLPAASAPAANYLPFVRHGDQLFISGQVSISAADSVRGKLGQDLKLEDGQGAARVSAINVLAQASAALDGDLERIVRIIRIGVFVASAPHFTDHHLVANGASDLLVGVLGDRGRHARAAIGLAALPLDAAVEVEAVIAVR